MKNINSAVRKGIVVLGSTLAFPCMNVNAGTVMGNGGATEVTQVLNNVQLVLSLVTQAQTLKAQLDNMKGLGNFEWGAAQTHLQQVTDIVGKGQALSYSSQNIEKLFNDKYPGYRANGEGFDKQFESWSRTTLDSVRNSLEAAGLQSRNFANEELALSSIRSMTAGSSSAVQAAQAGAMVAAQQVEQLQKLRQLVMAQMQAHAAYVAKEQGEKDWQKTFADTHFRTYKPTRGEVFASKGGKR